MFFFLLCFSFFFHCFFFININHWYCQDFHSYLVSLINNTYDKWNILTVCAKCPVYKLHGPTHKPLITRNVNCTINYIHWHLKARFKTFSINHIHLLQYSWTVERGRDRRLWRKRYGLFKNKNQRKRGPQQRYTHWK